MRIISAGGEGVDADAAHVLAAPVHRDESLADAHFFRLDHPQHHFAAPAFHPHDVARGQIADTHIGGVERDQRLFHMAVETANGAGAAHAMPLVAQAAGGQVQRVASIDTLGNRFVFGIGKFGFAAAGRKHAVFIQAHFAAAGAFRERPLLRALAIQQRIAEAGDVQIAACSGGLVLVKHLLHLLVGEQAGLTRTQTFFQPPGKVDHDFPIVARFARCRHGWPHMGNASLGVGHRAFFLAPAAGRQQHVGVGGGIGLGVSLLHHHQLGLLQGFAHDIGIRHRLRRVGAGNPQQLDFTFAYGVEHFHCRLARLGRHAVDAPQLGHFGAMFGIGQVTMTRQQGSQPANLAPPHGVGLAGKAERPGTGLADLAGGQMQVDQCRVFISTTTGLIQAHAIQAERGT